MIHFEKDETILLEVRRHWFYIALRVIALVLSALVPLSIFLLVLVFQGAPSQEVVILSALLYTFFLLILWISFFIFWTNYYLDVWYVTNQRVIDVEQHSLFSREITTLHYDRVQDVTIEIDGIVATFLGFGTIHVHTASGDLEVIMRVAANPYEAKKAIDGQVAERNNAVEGLRKVLSRTV